MSAQFQNPIEKQKILHCQHNFKIQSKNRRKSGEINTVNTNIHYRSFHCLVQTFQYKKQVTGLNYGYGSKSLLLVK